MRIKINDKLLIRYLLIKCKTFMYLFSALVTKKFIIIINKLLIDLWICQKSKKIKIKTKKDTVKFETV